MFEYVIVIFPDKRPVYPDKTDKRPVYIGNNLIGYTDFAKPIRVDPGTHKFTLGPHYHPPYYPPKYHPNYPPHYRPDWDPFFQEVTVMGTTLLKPLIIVFKKRGV